jgi:hypothetical protein
LIRKVLKLGAIRSIVDLIYHVVSGDLPTWGPVLGVLPFNKKAEEAS